MQITFIKNAAALFTADGFTLLTDPWLIDGAFHGSWCHYPPPKTTVAELVDKVDALYISHAHPDHHDETTLDTFPRDLPIYVVDQPPNILQRLLAGMGFTAVTVVPERTPTAVGPFTATLFRSHDPHPNEAAAVVNILDSSLLLQAGEVSVMNFNDNIPSLESSRALRAEYGRWTATMLQYSAAGPFPSCFENLTYEAQLEAQERVRQKFIDAYLAVHDILEPDIAIPFAGQFVIGGKHADKNPVLGTLPVERLHEAACQHGLTTARMSEGRTLDLTDLSFSGAAYVPFDPEACQRYVDAHLATRRYAYEAEALPEDAAFIEEMATLLPVARQHLADVQARLDAFIGWKVSVRFADRCFVFDMSNAEPGVTLDRLEESDQAGPLLAMEADPRVLRNILSGAFHFNNAMVGLHVQFHRRPETYNADLYTLLSYLHVPRRHPLARPLQSSSGGLLPASAP